MSQSETMINIDKKEYLMHPNQRLRVMRDYDPESDLEWWDSACKRCGVYLFRGEQHICSTCQSAIDEMMSVLGTICL